MTATSARRHRGRVAFEGTAAKVVADRSTLSGKHARQLAERVVPETPPPFLVVLPFMPTAS